MEAIKKEMENVKKINMEEVSNEMKKVKIEMEQLGPKIEKEMSRAKVEIEKARTEIKEYKTFVDGLDKEGIINKKSEYTIRHEDGQLLINGKNSSAETYLKYKDFLEKHPRFEIKKTSDDFDLDID
jgi:hypothetical protein